jgi:multidrug resistance efflux pump
MNNKPTPHPKTIRCAIYTRKSTEEGLDQQFNSLDAQREAAEAYIRSQKCEGWEIVYDRYDDGGFSGGNIERPALQRLMEDTRQAMEATQQGRKELESHQTQLTRQLSRDHSEVQQLVLDQQPNHSIIYRLSDIQQRIDQTQQQLAKVNRQLLELEKQELSTQEIAEAFIDFDRIWEALTMREQSQLLALLVSKVEFDQSDCTIAITFHSSGIESLEQQAEEV